MGKTHHHLRFQINGMKRTIAIINIAWLMIAWPEGAKAQHHSIGLSVHYGDRMTIRPELPGSFRPRRSVSPTVSYVLQQSLGKTFSLWLGAQAGVAGYQLVPVLRDTLGPNGGPSPFVEYGIFVARGEVLPGKMFQLRNKTIFLGLGGGFSYYYVFFPYTTMDVWVAHQGTAIHVFSAEAEAPDSGTLSGFVKATVRVTTGKRWSVALSYSHHLQSMLSGNFTIYRTPMSVAGTFRLVPSGFSISLLYQLTKGKNAS